MKNDARTDFFLDLFAMLRALKYYWLSLLLQLHRLKMASSTEQHSKKRLVSSLIDAHRTLEVHTLFFLLIFYLWSSFVKDDVMSLIKLKRAMYTLWLHGARGKKRKRKVQERDIVNVK